MSRLKAFKNLFKNKNVHFSISSFLISMWHIKKDKNGEFKKKKTLVNQVNLK